MLDLDEGAAFDDELVPRGFRLVRDRTWVRERTPIFRDVLQLTFIKGFQMYPCWGIDLAFVPAPCGRSLRWKRQPKDVVIHLCFDPVDGPGRIPDELDIGAAQGPEALARVAATAVRLAVGDLDPIDNLRAFDETLAVRSNMTWTRFSPDNYDQTHLAWGLALHALGDDTRGDEHLARFCKRLRIARADRLLARAVAGAAQLRPAP